MKLLNWIKTIVEANKIRREDIVTLKSVIDILDRMVISADIDEVLRTELDLMVRRNLIRMFARKGGRV